jgi:anti-sigma factor RsiW
MTTGPDPIGEDDLQRAVDGRLAPARAAEVEARLAEHPELVARVAAERRDVAALRRALAGIAEEPVPARLRPAAIRAARRQRRVAQMRMMAAGLALLMIGAGGGWWAGQRSPQPAQTVASRVSGEAVAAYRTYVVEVAHPVEVRSDNEKHLIAWLSKRLGRQLAAPDLTPFGYSLMGGRLLPGDQGAAAQLMYEAKGGERLTLYVGAAQGGETAFRFFQEGDTATLAWLDQGYGFAVTAAMSRDALTPIAEAVYRALDGGAGKG